MSSKTKAVAREQAVRAAIARTRDSLLDLDRRRAAASRELQRLQAELGALGPMDRDARAGTTGPSTAVPSTPAEKVALFRSLFRGRDDV
jgi:hypothetical protein